MPERGAILARARAYGLDYRSAALAASVAGVAGLGWVVSVDRMDGMDMGPGTDLGSFGFFLGIWVTMMAAMMLPSVLPAVLAFERSRRGGGAMAASSVFAATYLAVWTAVGVAAFLIYQVVSSAHPAFLAWDDGGAYAAGAAIAAAGLYELAPIKRACLRRCRASGDVLAGPPLRMGLRYGGYCVGASAGLMLALFALGVMSVLWMLVIALVVFVQRVTAVGLRSVIPVALLLVGLGIWIAAAPSSVPGLTQPM
jgi:predicted metal-binding membrane protein